LTLSWAVVLTSCLHSPVSFDEKKWLDAVNSRSVETLYSPHFKDGTYFNPWMPMEDRGFAHLLGWWFSLKPDYTDEEKSSRPRILPDLKVRIQSMPDGDFIAWVGHATFLMRLNGEYWLTDPMFSERALLPKRKTTPAITAEDLRDITGKVNVIVSHNHYDHLDAASIRALPDDGKVYVPLGLKSTIQDLGRKRVEEMDWWQSVDCGNGIRLVCLPAQHWSRRITQGTNTTLWASFLLITPNATIYYGGDSGYFVGFREFGRRFPGIDYALLPITAYRPRWFMHYAHVNVREALRAFQDINAHFFIPTQWGAFELGDEPIGYGLLDLQRTMKDLGFDESKMIIMGIGEIVSIPKRNGG
jgi:N-acyl-phosphatidylethanolamine-hydrolysing phospholipase D